MDGHLDGFSINVNKQFCILFLNCNMCIIFSQVVFHLIKQPSDYINIIFFQKMENVLKLIPRATQNVIQLIF